MQYLLELTVEQALALNRAAASNGIPFDTSENMVFTDGDWPALTAPAQVDEAAAWLRDQGVYPRLPSPCENDLGALQSLLRLVHNNFEFHNGTAVAGPEEGPAWTKAVDEYRQDP